ncbi:MAG: prephenate dehydratase [Cyanobacteria bacterium]|nr:prephenate dehydratase [Cyanobacteriota bacterium]MDA1021481.1 prephenate dehydratase [Cyanobacteriota bacterium]
MQVSYLGPEGSYTHIAAQKVFNGADLIPSSTITNIVHDLAVGLVDRAIVPVENSIAGGVAETIEALQQSEDIYVIQEFILPIDHCLLALPSFDKSKLAQTQKIRAHHMALGQCMDYIRNNLPNVEILPSSSNSSAAKALKANEAQNPNQVVIASELCAEIYGLDLIAKAINDSDINETRFWILSKNLEDFNPAAKNKTTILFQTKDAPGSLQVILRLFAVNNVNLSRIESRPAKKNIGEYLFLVDFDLHKEDPRYDTLVRQVRQHFSYFKWLGSYSLV